MQAIDGNLYGTSYLGGGSNGNGDGTVFQITTGGTLTTLHTFDLTDGKEPEAGLIQAIDGNLYGTTAFAGPNGGAGTVFEISPTLPYTLNVLYTFCSRPDCVDGESPQAALIQTSDGNFYGTTASGGANAYGTVFRLTAATLIPTTTTLGTAPNPSNVGQSVTLTGTVTAQDGSTPTGMVVFKSNGVVIGSASLSSGVAVLNYAGLPAGTDIVTAVYEGSATLAPSTSNAVMQVVNPLASLTAVTSTPNPSIFGQQATITATVAPSGPPAPTGTVSFTANGMAISGCTAVILSSQMASCATSALAVGDDAIAANYSGDSNYAGSSGMLTQIVNPVPTPLQFVSATPCRLVDTRSSSPILGGTSQSFTLPQLGGCNIPSSAQAYSLNVTAVPHRPLGYLTIWPTGEAQPVVSTLNSQDGRVKANAAIVPAGASGAVSVYVTDTSDVILDIDGYFTSPASGTLQFYPLTPCRVVDTRANSNEPQGLGPPSLGNMETRQLPILTTTCPGLPANPAAYSFNLTAVPYPAGQSENYVTLWPSDQPQPGVSTLNNYTATVVANAAIVPAAPDRFHQGVRVQQHRPDPRHQWIFRSPGAGRLFLLPNRAVSPVRQSQQQRAAVQRRPHGEHRQ